MEFCTTTLTLITISLPSWGGKKLVHSVALYKTENVIGETVAISINKQISETENLRYIAELIHI